MHRGIRAVVLGCVVLVTGCATPSGPLAVLPMTSPAAAQDNLEGIQQYQRRENGKRPRAVLNRRFEPTPIYRKPVSTWP